jgi:AcrR family transcriptional regulator
VTDAAAAPARPDQRGRILATALDLMAERGAAVTSMRQLADACGLNVATLYHYFPSKADLIRAVIEDRRYLEQLAEELPPVDPALPPADRLTAMLQWLWRATLAEDALIRLILSESLRAEPPAIETVRTLIDAMDDGFERWLGELLPELDDVQRPAVARAIRGQLFSLVVESLVVPPAERPARFDTRATELASMLLR